MEIILKFKTNAPIIPTGEAEVICQCGKAFKKDMGKIREADTKTSFRCPDCGARYVFWKVPGLYWCIKIQK